MAIGDYVLDAFVFKAVGFFSENENNTTTTTDITSELSETPVHR